MLAIESPPSRYSVSSPDYDHNVGMRIRVFCGGVEMQQVIEYDCEAGTVLKFKRSTDGEYQLNEKRDEALSETVLGVVTVEWRDEAGGVRKV